MTLFQGYIDTLAVGQPFEADDEAAALEHFSAWFNGMDCGAAVLNEHGETLTVRRVPTDRDDWPVHQPGPAYEAPIPGIHWYAGCDPDQPRVDPSTGICEGCGERACGECGRSNCPDHDGRLVGVPDV